MINNFLFFPVCIKTVTNEFGQATISIKIPGLFGLDGDNNFVTNPFNGFQIPSPQGRYLDRCEIWSDIPSDGDIVYGMQIVDLDNVIPEEYRNNFPNYPVIQSFQENEIEETDELKGGLYLNENGPVKINSFGHVATFVPSGLYLKGSFKSTQSNKIVRCNFYWGKKIL